jgi:hypothetical protein
VMATSKAAWVGGIALAAGIGFLGGGATEGFGLFDPERDAARPPALDGVASSRPEEGPAPTREDAATLAAMGDEADLAATQENRRLTTRVAELERELAARPAAAPAAPRGPLFTFGEMGRLDAVREADWASLGSASKVVSDSILEIFQRNEAGEPVPKEVYRRLQENVERVRTYEYRTIDRMPTAAQHNGELTHPISATNLLASVLEQGGEPLSPAQVAEFDRLGVAFESDFARVRAGWASDVPRARRLLEEVRLKGRFMDALWAGLTPAQRPLWVDPAYRGVASIDLFDPTLMVIHTSPIVTGAAVPELRGKLLTMLRPKVALATDAADARLDAAVDAFVARTGRNLTAVPRVRVKHYTFADSVQAGEATADLVDALLREFPLSADARKALLEDPSWYVLRLVAA